MLNLGIMLSSTVLYTMLVGTHTLIIQLIEIGSFGRALQNLFSKA